MFRFAIKTGNSYFTRSKLPSAFQSFRIEYCKYFSAGKLGQCNCRQFHGALCSSQHNKLRLEKNQRPAKCTFNSTYWIDAGNTIRLVGEKLMCKYRFFKLSV